VTTQPLESDKQRVNLLIKRSNDAKPKLIFNTHLDTVPPYLPPKVDGDRIDGRGSNDAKGMDNETF
jgi:acetylornithine deacetylase